MTDAVNEVRSVAELCSRLATGWQPGFLFFWGHQPEKDGSVGKGCFSQWFPSKFSAEGDRYFTAEHYMMAGKARLFGDEKARAQVLLAGSPADAKAIGRGVRDFDGGLWNKERFDIVVRGNLEKFGQNPAMRDYLLGTGEQILVEASPRDRIWGIGMGASNPDAQQPQNWRGLNLLGFALMAARGRLRRAAE